MADEQTPGFTPGALKAAIELLDLYGRLDRPSMFAEIISRKTCDRELLEALEAIKRDPAARDYWSGAKDHKPGCICPICGAEAAIRKARGR